MWWPKCRIKKWFCDLRLVLTKFIFGFKIQYFRFLHFILQVYETWETGHPYGSSQSLNSPQRKALRRHTRPGPAARRGRWARKRHSYGGGGGLSEGGGKRRRRLLTGARRWDPATRGSGYQTTRPGHTWRGWEGGSIKKSEVIQRLSLKFSEVIQRLSLKFSLCLFTWFVTTVKPQI